MSGNGRRKDFGTDDPTETDLWYEWTERRATYAVEKGSGKGLKRNRGPRDLQSSGHH